MVRQLRYLFTAIATQRGSTASHGAFECNEYQVGTWLLSRRDRTTRSTNILIEGVAARTVCRTCTRRQLPGWTRRRSGRSRSGQARSGHALCREAGAAIHGQRTAMHCWPRWNRMHCPHVAMCAEAAGGRQACRQAGRQQAGSSRQQHRQQQAGSSSSGSSTSITLPVAIM